MRARMMNGYWIMKAPCGYKMEKRPGHGKIMVRQEPLATLVQKGLEGFASGRFSSVVELRAFFAHHPDFPRSRNGSIHLQRIIDMLHHLVYTGYYEFPQWGISLMKGKHEPIISYETYVKIQARLDAREKAPARKDIDQEFLLRGFMLCDCCQHPLTSCWTQARYGKYPYYLCHNRKCDLYGKSIKRDQAEQDFEELLKKLSPAPGTVDLMLQIVEEAREERLGSFKLVAEDLKKEKELIEIKIAQLVDRVVATVARQIICQ